MWQLIDDTASRFAAVMRGWRRAGLAIRQRNLIQTARSRAVWRGVGNQAMIRTRYGAMSLVRTGETATPSLVVSTISPLPMNSATL